MRFLIWSAEFEKGGGMEFGMAFFFWRGVLIFSGTHIMASALFFLSFLSLLGLDHHISSGPGHSSDRARKGYKRYPYTLPRSHASGFSSSEIPLFF